MFLKESERVALSSVRSATARALLRGGAPCSEEAVQLARDARESEMLALLDTAPACVARQQEPGGHAEL